MSTVQNTSTPVTSVCYVEVNSNSITNVGDYTLATSGQPAVNVAVIFAANINYDPEQEKAVLYLNPQVTDVLNSYQSTIVPLQHKGIKVLLTVLGNHTASGICNFPTEEAAVDFAGQLADCVNTFGLDGIDFDDEWVTYGENGVPPANDFSFVTLVTSLRKMLPDKIISFYYIGAAATHQSYNGVTVGESLNYAWNPYYGTFNAPDVPGLGNSQLAAAAVDLTETPSELAEDFAKQTVNGGYGVYLYYNLTSADASGYFTGVTNQLYGQATVYSSAS